MSKRDAWEQIIRRFDPTQPPARSAWRAERPHGPLARINQRLNRRFQDHRILVSGTIGTGKSTELRALAESRAEREFVVLFDVHQHLTEVLNDGEALQRIEAWELAVLMALAAYRAAHETFGAGWTCPSIGLLEAAWSRLLPDEQASKGARVDLAKLTGSIALAVSDAISGGVGSALRLIARTSDAIRWDRPIGRLPGRLSEQDPRVVNLVDAANQVLRDIRQSVEVRLTAGRRVLMVVDGLDRIRDRAAALRLFTQSDSLARLDCWQLMTAPFVLRHDPALADTRGFLPFILVNEPVLDHDAPSQPNERAIAFFHEVYTHRVVDLPPDLISPKCLDRLAFYSGGRARDFVRLVQEVAGFAWDDDAEQASDAMVDRALDERRRLIENGLSGTDLDLLRAIIEAPRSRLEPSEHVERLLTHGLLLPYPNESEWFYPHPLLTLGLLRTP